MSSDHKFKAESCTPNGDLSPAWIIWDAAVDYITCSAKRDTHLADLLADIGLTELSYQQNEGQQPEGFSFQGYQGQKVGSCSVGYREDGILLRVSGSAAHKICCQMLETDQRFKPSRIDLQITGHCETEQPKRAREIYRQLEEHHEASGSKKPFNCDLRRRSKKGDCLYIGVRESPRFFRIYDKSKEQGVYVQDGLWRYEVECKGKQSKAVFDTLRLSKASQQVIIELVVAGFQSKHVDMSWVDKCNPNKLPSVYTKTTHERKLLWMRNNVSRTSKELIQAGYEQQLREWLGFDPNDVKPDK
jgi:DNA relaxase NicK